MFTKKRPLAPAMWLSWLEQHLVHHKGAGSIPGRACIGGNHLMFLSLINTCLSLPLSLKINKHILGED